MKRIILPLLFIALTSAASFAQEKATKESKSQVVEASCGQCNFGLSGNGCSLAVRIDKKAYFVEGSSLDDHGDAHGKDGFCSVVRKAKVEGEVKGDKFVATSFELLPVEEKKN